MKRNRVLPDDVAGAVIAEDLEIPVIRPYPLVCNFLDLDCQGIESDAAGRLIAPVSGVALDVDFHLFSPQRHPGETKARSRFTG